MPNTRLHLPSHRFLFPHTAVPVVLQVLLAVVAPQVPLLKGTAQIYFMSMAFVSMLYLIMTGYAGQNDMTFDEDVTPAVMFAVWGLLVNVFWFLLARRAWALY